MQRLPREVKILRTAALKAGARLAQLQEQRDDLTHTLKGSESDFKTLADDAADSIIRKHVEKHLPEARIFSEESGGTPDAETVVDVDPLDGTIAYVHGQQQYAVSLALRKGNDIRAGVVYLPGLKKMYIAWKGGGAWLQDHARLLSKMKKITVQMKPLKNAMVGMDLPYDTTLRGKALETSFKQFFQHATYVQMHGSSAFGLAQVAHGRFNAYAHNFLDVQGSTAGNLIAQEAGAKVTDWNGHAPNYASGKHYSLIVAHPKLHAEILELLKKKK